MRKYNKKLEYGRAQMAFVVLDQIIYEVDKICSSPRDKRADLLMDYRGRLYNLRSQYQLEMSIYKKDLNMED